MSASQTFLSIKPVTLELIRLSTPANLICKTLSDNCHWALLNTAAQFQGYPINFILTGFPYSIAGFLTHSSPDWNQSNENSQTAHKMSHYYESTHHFYRYFLSVTRSPLKWHSASLKQALKWQPRTVKTTSAVKFTALSLWSQPPKDTKCYSGINKTFIGKGRKGYMLHFAYQCHFQANNFIRGRGMVTCYF